MKTKKAFSLLEIVMAMAFMSVALLSMFWMNRASNKGSMDAYYELLAFSLAKEPIEVFRSFGYDCVRQIADGNVASPKRYKIGSAEPITFDDTDMLQYPAEAKLFQRRIDLKVEQSGSVNAVRVTVTVSNVGQSKAAVWMSRNAVKLEGLIVESPK